MANGSDCNASHRLSGTTPEQTSPPRERARAGVQVARAKGCHCFVTRASCLGSIPPFAFCALRPTAWAPFWAAKSASKTLSPSARATLNCSPLTVVVVVAQAPPASQPGKPHGRSLALSLCHCCLCFSYCANFELSNGRKLERAARAQARSAFGGRRTVRLFVFI